MTQQPWTCHGLHESWQGRCQESFRIHGQPASADIGDSCYFLGSANVGWSWRFFSDISLNSNSVTIRTYTADFIYLFLCTDTGVIATHALSFYWPLAPLSYWLMCSSLLWLRAAPYCTLLCTVTYCCSDAIVAVTLLFLWRLLFTIPIVLLQYLSQACWVLCSPRLDFFHWTVISTLVAANRLRIPIPPLPEST